MDYFLKIKKSKFIIFSLIIFNQFLFNGYALNYKKIELDKSENNNLERELYNPSSILLAERKNQTSYIKDEKKEIDEFANKIEDFVKETLGNNDFEGFKNKTDTDPKDDNFDELERQSINKNNNPVKLQKKYSTNSQEFISRILGSKVGSSSRIYAGIISKLI